MAEHNKVIIFFGILLTTLLLNVKSEESAIFEDPSNNSNLNELFNLTDLTMAEINNFNQKIDDLSNLKNQNKNTSEMLSQIVNSPSNLREIINKLKDLAKSSDQKHKKHKEIMLDLYLKNYLTTKNISVLFEMIKELQGNDILTKNIANLIGKYKFKHAKNLLTDLKNISTIHDIVKTVLQENENFINLMLFANRIDRTDFRFAIYRATANVLLNRETTNFEFVGSKIIKLINEMEKNIAKKVDSLYFDLNQNFDYKIELLYLNVVLKDYAKSILKNLLINEMIKTVPTYDISVWKFFNIFSTKYYQEFSDAMKFAIDSVGIQIPIIYVMNKLEQIVSALVAYTEKMNESKEYPLALQMANFARAIEESPGFKSMPSEAKDDFYYLKNHLMLKSLKNLVFSKRVCIKNLKYDNEYISFNNSLNSGELHWEDEWEPIIDDKNLPSVFVIFRNDMNKTSYMYDGGEETITTSEQRENNNGTKWMIECKEKFCYIRSALTQQAIYLEVKDKKKSVKKRNKMETDLPDSAKWVIEKCDGFY